MIWYCRIALIILWYENTKTAAARDNGGQILCGAFLLLLCWHCFSKFWMTISIIYFYVLHNIGNEDNDNTTDSGKEWKIQKLEFSKSEKRLRSWSHHWFPNSFRNHYRTNILLLNWANIFYRKRSQIWNHTPISSYFHDNWNSNHIFRTPSQLWFHNSFRNHDHLSPGK